MSDQKAVRPLIIVPRNRSDLFVTLRRSFGDDVIVDRRVGDRRTATGGHDPERRREERRRRADVEAELRAGKWIAVTVPAERFDADDRAILLLCCSDHQVACQTCQETYRLRWLGRDEAERYSCPRCAGDLTGAVVAHTETCHYWVSRGSARMKSPAKLGQAAREAATG